MLKYQDNDFPSDLFLILETVGAGVFVAKGPLPIDVEMTSVAGFLSLDMNKKVLLKISLPARDSDAFILKTYKVRRQFLQALN